MSSAATISSDQASSALGQVFNSVLPRLVSCARDSAAPARGLMGFGLLMMIARLRAEGVTVTRAELARRLNKSQQMFSPHVDNLVELGLLAMTRVPGGHGTGTQWHLDLVDDALVEALRPLVKAIEPKVEGLAAEGGADDSDTVSGRLNSGKVRGRRASRSAPRTRA